MNLPTPTSGRSVTGPLLEAAAGVGERVALVARDESVTFGELTDRAGRVAAGLARRGVRPGDRVAVFLDKVPEVVATLYGVWMAGGVAVPVNETLRLRQVVHVAGHSRSRLLVTAPALLRRLGGDATGRPPEQLGGARVVEVADLPDEPAPQPSGVVRPDGESPAALLYTSGSTGRPKGIVVSHDNLLAGARIVAGYLGIGPDDRILSVLPFSFDYGLNQLLVAVERRATLVLQRSHLPADVCRTLADQAVTVVAGVPPLWIQLLGRGSPFPRERFPALRVLTNSGGALPVDVVRAYRRLVPQARLFLMYGLTEAFRSTYLPPEEVDRRPTSIGRAIPECEVLVLGDDGRRCGPGEVGELVHRGPTVALGYWDDPEATAAVFRPDPADPCGRVVHSGDLVRADDEGFLYFVGRRDELIKTSGYRVSPTEVEEVVLESGLVSEAVVVGEPDEVAGHVVVVHCVPGNPTGFDPAALLTHCRSELPRHMVPRAVHVHGAFPRTPSGKVDRAAVAASSGWQELPSLGAVAPDAGAAGSGRSGRAPGPEALRKEVAS